MEVSLAENVALLRRTPGVLDALLRGLPEGWTMENEGEVTWTVFDVIGHMAHCERDDWMPRARMILTQGEAMVFPPLDRSAHFAASQGRTLDALLDEFASLRGESIAALEGLNLTADQLVLRGTHPAFGSVTLGQLLHTWTVHDLTHLHQISRILAHQRREEVGPWSAYLGVLKCSPTS